MLLTVTSPVPRWATSNGNAPYITRPDDGDFKEFMTAVAREFGSEVSVYSIWNEPNHPAFLLPQFNSNGTPASPRIYRGLYQAGYAGLQAAGIAHPQVLFGETAPTGYDTVKSMLHSKIRSERANALLHDVAPLAFMREALCLNAHYKKAGSCGELQMTGYAHHAYTDPAGPFFVTPDRDDVTIGALSRLSNALNLAARAHAIPGERADLPDRVRGAELPEQAARRAGRQAGRIRRDLPNTSPRKTRAWRPSRSTCSKTTRSAERPARASTAAPSASRRASST